jgi:hypothetical protein
MDNRAPAFSADQARHLDTVFPDKCARVGMTLEQIWMEAGMRKVVEHVKSLVPGRHSGTDLNIDAEAIAGAARATRRR